MSVTVTLLTVEIWSPLKPRVSQPSPPSNTRSRTITFWLSRSWATQPTSPIWRRMGVASGAARSSIGWSTVPSNSDQVRVPSSS